MVGGSGQIIGVLGQQVRGFAEVAQVLGIRQGDVHEREALQQATNRAEALFGAFLQVDVGAAGIDQQYGRAARVAG